MNQSSIAAKARSLLDRHFSGAQMDWRAMRALFLPILVDQAFLVGLNLVNTALVSSSGVAAIGAVSTIDALNIFLINVFIAVATGGTVVVAQYKGSRNDAMVSRAAAGSIGTVSLLSLAIGMLVLALHGPALRMLFGAGEPEVVANAETYLIGSGLSYLGVGVVQAVSGVMRGIGKSQVALALSLIMNVSYVLLNVLFIVALDMGVLGLSIATNIARYAAAACALFYVFKDRKSTRLNSSHIQKSRMPSSA